MKVSFRCSKCVCVQSVTSGFDSIENQKFFNTFFLFKKIILKTFLAKWMRSIMRISFYPFFYDHHLPVRFQSNFLYPLLEMLKFRKSLPWSFSPINFHTHMCVFVSNCLLPHHRLQASLPLWNWWKFAKTNFRTVLT